MFGGGRVRSDRDGWDERAAGRGAARHVWRQSDRRQVVGDDVLVAVRTTRTALI